MLMALHWYNKGIFHSLRNHLQRFYYGESLNQTQTEQTLQHDNVYCVSVMGNLPMAMMDRFLTANRGLDNWGSNACWMEEWNVIRRPESNRMEETRFMY